MDHINVAFSTRVDIRIMAALKKKRGLPWLSNSQTIRDALNEYVNILIERGETDLMSLDEAISYLDLKRISNVLAAAVGREDGIIDTPDIGAAVEKAKAKMEESHED